MSKYKIRKIKATAPGSEPDEDDSSVPTEMMSAVEANEDVTITDDDVLTERISKLVRPGEVFVPLTDDSETPDYYFVGDESPVGEDSFDQVVNSVDIAVDPVYWFCTDPDKNCVYRLTQLPDGKLDWVLDPACPRYILDSSFCCRGRIDGSPVDPPAEDKYAFVPNPGISFSDVRERLSGDFDEMEFSVKEEDEEEGG